MPVDTWSPTDIHVTERKRLEKPLLWVFLISTISFAIAAGGPLYLLIGLFGFAINYAAVLRNREIWFGRLTINMCVLIATAILLVEILALQTDQIVALGRYMVLILICKLFEKRRSRDTMQILLLSLLLMVATAVWSQSIWLALVMVLWLGLMVYTAMVFSVKRGADAAATLQQSTAAGADVRQLAWNIMRSWPRKALMARTVGALVVLLVAGVGMFVALPRLALSTDPLLGPTARQRQEQNASTGFGSDVHLGEPRRIYESDRLVGYVRYEPRPGAGLPTSAYYLRGQVYSYFVNGRWDRQPSPTEGPDLDSARAEAWIARQGFAQHVELRSSLLPTLFSAYPTLAVRSNDGRAFIAADNSARMVEADPAETFVTYTAWSVAPVPRQLAREMAARRRRGRMPWFALGLDPPLPQIQVPERVAALAREWTATLEPPAVGAGSEALDEYRQKASLLLAQKLRSHCSYTLDLSEADPGRDPVIDFLFYMRKGHCEYFATAHVMLCRALDIPSRLATGFALGTERDDRGRAVIRERDAHAWTEIYTRQNDWVIVDATPGARALPQTATWTGRAQAWWRSVEFWWRDHVQGFDQSMQDRVAEWIYLRMAAIARGLQIGWESLLALLAGRQTDLLLAAATLAILLLSAGMIVLAVRMLARLGSAPRRRDLSRMPRDLARVIRAATRRGQPWQPSQTLREWAASAAEALALPQPALAELVDFYYDGRFSGRPLPPERVRQIHREAAALAGQIRTVHKAGSSQ